jgi:protein-S-isoprenylcysteine O-methyltransferase Ste14
MLLVKLAVSIVIQLAAFAALLFLPAGTLQWPRAWFLFGIVCATTLASLAILLPDRTGLLNERLKLPIQKGQPFADKIVTLLIGVTFCGLLAFIPLDVFRLHLMDQPGTVVSALGLVLFGAGWWIATLALKENAFAAPVVKYQQDRRQTVVDSGVYGVVRHPMYAGATLVLVGTPLWLQSYAATGLAIVPIGVLLLRIWVEERFLRQNLAGYDAYAERVRFRLIPFVW